MFRTVNRYCCLERLLRYEFLIQLIFPGITFETHIDVRIVSVYEVIKLTGSKVVYFGTFKYAASGPSQTMSYPLV